MLGYIYKTTNLVNQHIYIGQHKGIFDSTYLGSGKYLLRAVKKYGKNNFKINLIAIANSKDELDELEIKFIAIYKNANNKNSIYNITKGGESGSDTFINNPNKEQIREKLSLIMLNKYKNGYINPFKGKHLTPEQLKNYKGRKGKICSKATKSILREIAKRNWAIKEIREKMKLGMRGKCGPKTEESKQKCKLAIISYWKNKKSNCLF